MHRLGLLGVGVGVLEMLAPTVLGLPRGSVAGTMLRLVGAGTATVGTAILLSERSERLVASALRIAPRPVDVTKSITIACSADELYRFWHDLRNLPRVMAHLEAIEPLSDQRSRWRARAPGGETVEWEAEIVQDRPGELIGWRSVEGSDLEHRGTVRFARAPGGRGTEVTVEMRYQAPAGRLGAAVAKLFGREPSQQIDGDLRRLKQLMETGEVVHSDASIHRMPHPARPERGDR